MEDTKLPSGWKMVPVEPTEDMVVMGFSSTPCVGFTPIDEMEAYEAMSGCQQAAHRARLCYAAMLAAAPAPVQQAAPSELADAPFMWAIMSPDGTPHFDEMCVSGSPGDLSETVYYLNEDQESSVYRVVAVYVRPPAPGAAPAQPAGLSDGVMKAARALLDEHEAACATEPMFALLEMAEDDEEALVSAALLADLFKAVRAAILAAKEAP